MTTNSMTMELAASTADGLIALARAAIEDTELGQSDAENLISILRDGAAVAEMAKRAVNPRTIQTINPVPGAWTNKMKTLAHLTKVLDAMYGPREART
jgi:hypothetical protein